MVGGYALRYALENSAVKSVTSIGRKKLGISHPRLKEVLHADAKQTDFCVYLSVILLLGLGLNAALGWRWADLAAALIMVPLAKEGIQAMKGETCCD
jgi:divalent metal cation (Fe/Co/Zn/Cd) transporter